MEKEKSIYEELSDERKLLQEQGKLPKWCTTLSWQLLKEKYLSDSYPDLESVYRRIANHAAQYTSEPAVWQEKFFNLLWNGWLAASTPILSNMGTGYGCPVSCSGSAIDDSVYGFYSGQLEAAILSKNGFGTSGYLGAIRPRGSKITGTKGTSSGVLPVFKDFIQLSRDISQGSQRRGAWAGYIEIEHGDFYELVTYIGKNPDDANIGWIIGDDFIQRLDDNDKDAVARYQTALKLKMITGKGYFLFIDKVNRANPQMYKDKNLKVKASNLCVSGDSSIRIKIDSSDTESTISIKDIKQLLNDGVAVKTASYNTETAEIEYKPIVNFALTKKNAKLMKITDTKTGKYIKCTPCHLIYTKNRGYVEAANLLETDELELHTTSV